MSGDRLCAASGVVRVVLAPDVVGGLWLDASCAAVFEAWRNERLLPIVNRALLVRYLRLWRVLGLTPNQTRRWSWWFTSASRACFLGDDPNIGSSAVECCSSLAILGGAFCVLHRGTISPPEGTARWLTAAEFQLPYAG
jgi:hypothetical protein